MSFQVSQIFAAIIFKWYHGPIAQMLRREYKIRELQIQQ